MSVWDEACYNTDALCAILRCTPIHDLNHPFLLKFAQFVVPDDPSLSSGFPPGVFAKSAQENPFLYRKLEPLTGSRPLNNAAAVFLQFSQHKIHFGLEAVYKVFAACVNGEVRHGTELDTEWIMNYTKSFLHLSGFASYSSPKDTKAMLETLSRTVTWNTRMLKFEQLSESFRHTIFMAKAASYAGRLRQAAQTFAKLPEAPKNLIWFGKTWHVYKFGPSLFLEREGILQNTLYILTSKDIDRLIQMLHSLSDMEMYFAVYDRLQIQGRLYDQYRVLLEDIVDVMKSTHRVNEVARAYDVAYGLLMAHIASDFWDKAIVDQTAKIKAERLDEICDIQAFVTALRRNPIAEAIELSKIYKFLPTPDFDLFNVLTEQKKKHANTNSFLDERYNSLNLSIGEFKKYQKFMMLRTYQKKHGKLPGYLRDDVPEKHWHKQYPQMKANEVPWKDVDDIDYTGAFAYEDFGTNLNPTIKDKSLAPDRFKWVATEKELNESNSDQRNYLISYLTRGDLMSPEQAMEALAYRSERWDMALLAAPKPESKKPSPRNFYMASYHPRSALSEMETSIANYLMVKPGSFAGISFTESFNKMLDMCGDDLEHHQYEYRLMSFDIKGWSPNMSPEVRRLQLDKWATAFNRPNIRALDRIFTDSEVFWIKKGVKQSYKLNGNDLEGFVGRLNTDVHIDIMGYIIRKLREANYLHVGAKLAALIDDGVCALKFPKGTAHNTMVEVVNKVADAYRYFSFEISWDKTYVSEHMYVFLNEVFYKRRKITPGVKAFLRIRIKRQKSIACFLRDHNQMQGMVRGAVQAGCPNHLAEMKYAWELGKLIHRWKGREPLRFDAAVFLSFVPVAYGGLGAVPILHMLANIADDATTTNIGHLKAIAYNDRTFANVVNQKLNKPIAAKSSLSTLRAPLAYHIDGPHLTDTKEAVLLERALHSRVRNPLVRSALDTPLSVSEQTVATIMKAMPTQRKAYAQHIYDSLPISLIDSIKNKFQRSQAIAQMLTPQDCVRVYGMYRIEFLRVIRAA